jgi:hypothetical protein
MTLNYLCLVDGVVEYGSTDLNDFNHYRSVYYEDHRDAENVEYLVLTDDGIQFTDEELKTLTWTEISSPHFI